MLILVPTELEQAVLLDALDLPGRPRPPVELIGFGLVAAAARTAQLLTDRRPDGVLLLGIAGSLAAEDHCLVGRAYRFNQVACHGVGVGTGPDFVSAGQLGWPQWPAADPATAVGDLLKLADAPAHSAGAAGSGGCLLLSAAAASASADDVAVRRRLFPDAVAEDMEGFAVAAACRLAGVPCRIIRGISNRAGDRDKAGWQIEPALRAAAELACGLLEDVP
mgnify:FL=1